VNASHGPPKPVDLTHPWLEAVLSDVCGLGPVFAPLRRPASTTTVGDWRAPEDLNAGDMESSRR